MDDGVQLYAATQQGLFISRPINGTWQEVGRASEGGIPDGFAECRNRPERVFVAVVHDGLYRTDDAGRDWRKVLDGHVDHGSEGLNPLWGGPGEVYVTHDHGDHWQNLNLDLPPIRAIKVVAA